MKTSKLSTSQSRILNNAIDAMQDMIQELSSMDGYDGTNQYLEHVDAVVALTDAFEQLTGEQCDSVRELKGSR